MMRTATQVLVAAATAGAVLLAQPVWAAGPGAGKLTASVIATPGTAGAKALGKFQAKPADSKAGQAPTAGVLQSFKFQKDIGDPLKPGLAPGDYVVEIETAATPDGESNGSGRVETFARFNVDSAFKCTFQTNPTADTGSSSCGGAGQPLCAPAAAGKCTITTYQIIGPAFLASLSDGLPAASRILVRTLPDTTHCCSGDTLLGGVPVQACNGPTSCKGGAVVGVVGIASGNIQE